MSWTFLFILGSIATFRITCAVTRDLGPYRIFARLRKLSPMWLSCPFCFSITAAVIVCAMIYLSGFTAPPMIWILLVFAFSAISICIDRTFVSDHNPQ